MAMKRLGILTGGGDVPVPELRESNRWLYRGQASSGYEVVGIRRGWEVLDPRRSSGPGESARATCCP